MQKTNWKDHVKKAGMMLGRAARSGWRWVVQAVRHVMSWLRQKREAQHVAHHTDGAVKVENRAVAGAKTQVAFRDSLMFRMLLRVFLVIVLMAIGLLGIVSPYVTKKMEDQIYIQMSNRAVNILARLQSYNENMLDTVTSVAQSFGKLETENDAMLTFLNIKSSSKRLKELLLIDTEGRVISRMGFAGEVTNDTEKPFKDHPFLTKGIDKAGYISPVQPNKSISTMFEINYAAPSLDIFDRVRYVLVAKSNLQLIWPSLRGTSQDDLIAFLVSPDDWVAASDDEALMNAQMRDASGNVLPYESWSRERLKKDGAYQDYVEHRLDVNLGSVRTLKTHNAWGEPVLAAYAVDPSTKIAVFVETPLKTALGPAQAVSRMMLWMIVIGLLLVVAGAYFSARAVTVPMRGLLQATTAIAAGDLTVRAALERRDEMGLLSRSFDRMTEELKQMIQSVGETALKTRETAVHLADVFEEVTQASEQVATTIEEIAQGAEDQALIAQRTDERVHHLDAQLEKVRTLIRTIEEKAKTTDEALRETDRALGRMAEGMQTVSENSEEMAGEVRALKEKFARISKIVAASQEIAARTNLLALNAAIEAARAGEHGKGFAVVAGEVRKLAEQSAASAKDIERIVREVTQAMQNVVESIETSEQVVAKEEKEVGSTRKVFETLSEAMQEVSRSVEEISRASEEEVAIFRALAEEAQSSAALSEETSAGAEEVAASSEETSATMNDLKTRVRELEKMANDLTERISRFKIEN
ncbi:MAG: methyl-accepting chemotaxis protein [Candidatus Carbobacillus altaicus]|nr:methyl-accepting chemotaxis protein [Candidatus Carbobacillus altaicus]